MRIGYLGPLEVRDGLLTVDVPGRRLRTLLARLAMDVGRAVPPRALTEALWPDEVPADPANALQSLVSRLRRTLGDASLVEQLPGGYRLNVLPDDVDAVRFASLAAQGRAQLGAGDAIAAAGTLREALDLWRGEPLPDDDSLEAEMVRARLLDLHLQVRADRIEADLTGVREGGSDLGEVVAEVERLSALHPMREDFAALRMRALVAVGRPAEALAAYEATRAYLAETLGSDPSPALQEQHLSVLRLQETGATKRQTNLRAALTSFVGRDHDADRVEALLHGSARLVTIVGTGGAGKTRLASEVAGAWVTRVRDGVWFAELAPVSDSGNIALAVLDGLGLRDVVPLDRVDRVERPMLEARDRVLQTLWESDCLLVLDNCEHVVDAAAALVADVLGQCPGVRIIATSREPLGIDGETIYPLTPLRVPGEGAGADEVVASAAVRLLLDRAKAAGADLVLDEATTADVAEVVRRLDGLPLAIELAAARLRVLSIGEVATRLGDRFRLLTGGRRTAMPRHRTLRAVVEWSWELLTPLERQVAEHFSVFGSGATAEAVAAVVPCADEGVIDDVLHALVDKSLLVAAQHFGEARFRMLETLREYGTERLAEQGELETARAAHADYFADLVRRADRHLRSERQIAWLRRLDAERDNALTGLAWLGEHDRAEAAVEMAVSMAWAWMLRENGKDAARWLRFALDVPGARDAPLYTVAEALHLISTFAMVDGGASIDGRGRLIELSDELAVAEQLHQVVPLLRPLLLFFADERERASALADRNLDHADPWVRAATRTIRASFHENDGDVEEMRKDVELGLVEWVAVGDHWGLASMLSSRGQLRTLDGDAEGAAADFEEALVHLRQLGGNSDDLMVNMHLADLRLRAGDLAGAREYAELVRVGEVSHGDFGQGLFTDIILAGVAMAEGDNDALDAIRERILATLAGIGEPTIFLAHATSVGHAVLATIATHRGDLPTARPHLSSGYTQALATLDLPIMASVGVAVADYALASGRPEIAAKVLGASARLRGSDDHTGLHIARVTAALQARLGAAFADNYGQGRLLSRDEALAQLDPTLLE